MNTALHHRPQWDTRLLEQVRTRFCHVDEDPFSGSRIYMENAGGGLTLKAALEASASWCALPDNAGRRHSASKQAEKTMRQGRQAVATLLGAKRGTIVVRESTTSCVFAILQAIAHAAPASADQSLIRRFEVGRRANIVCSNLDHPSTYDGLAYVEHHHGIERRIASLDPRTTAVPVEALLDQMDGNTLAVTIIHASNITGVKHDLAEYIQVIRDRFPDVYVLVDGAQHVQHGVVDVDALDIDAYVFSSYKVFSKAGAGFAYLSPRLATLPHPKLRGAAEDQWELGTRDVGNYAAFAEVVRYLAWLGREVDPDVPEGDDRAAVVVAMRAIEAYEASLTQRLLHGNGEHPGLLTDPRVRLHGPTDTGLDREAVFALTVQGFSCDEIVRGLMDHRIVIHDRISDAYSGHTLAAIGVDAVVRISFAHYTSPEEVDRLLVAWPQVLAELRRNH